MRNSYRYLCFSLVFLIGISSASIAAFFFIENSSRLMPLNETPAALDTGEYRGLHFTETMRACKGFTSDGAHLGYVQSYQGSDGLSATAGGYEYSTLAKAKQNLSQNAKKGTIIERKFLRKERMEVEYLTVELPDHTINSYQRKGKLILWITAPSLQHVEILKGLEGWESR